MITVLLAGLIRVTSPGPGAFTLVDSAPLPVYAETAAWAVPVGDELRLFINRPGRGDTAQLRVTAPLRISELPAVPMISAGAAACAHQLVLTGADSAGHPVVAVLAADGKVVQRISFKSGSTTILPGCLSRPVVVSHEQGRQLTIREIGAAGRGPARIVAVGDGPVEIVPVKRGLVAVWAEAQGVAGVVISATDVTSFHVPAARPQSMSAGECDGHVSVAWTEPGSAAFLVQLTSDLKPTPPLPLRFGEGKGGRPRVVSGARRLVWALRLSQAEGEAPRWISALATPGAPPVEFEGLVHDVASWRHGIVAVGAQALHLFR